MFHTDLLDEQILKKRGPFQRIRRWWRGIHPGKGTIVQGWTGWETVEEKDRFLPARIVGVVSKSTR